MGLVNQSGFSFIGSLNRKKCVENLISGQYKLDYDGKLGFSIEVKVHKL